MRNDKLHQRDAHFLLVTFVWLKLKEWLYITFTYVNLVRCSLLLCIDSLHVSVSSLALNRI